MKSKHMPKPIVKLNCNICDFSTYRPPYLRRHMFRHTGKNPLGDFECVQCCKRYYQQCELNVHIKLAHSVKPKVPCPACGKLYANEFGLSEHFKSIHDPKAAAMFLCHLCPKSYITDNKLKNHLKSSHAPKLYKCDYNGCMKSYRIFSKLKNHKHTHTEEKRFQCEQCPGKFMNMNFFMKHFRTNHLGWRYFCVYPGCNLEYFHKKDIKNHLKKHHTKDPLELEKYNLMLKDLKHHIVNVD